MKRTMNRLLIRFALLCVAIILGAIAVAQAQRGLESKDSLAKGNVEMAETAESTNEPIPLVEQPLPSGELTEVQPSPQQPIAWAAPQAERQLAEETNEPLEALDVESDHVNQTNYESVPIDRDEGQYAPEFDTDVPSTSVDSPDLEVPQFAPLAPPADNYEYDAGTSGQGALGQETRDGGTAVQGQADFNSPGYDDTADNNDTGDFDNTANYSNNTPDFDNTPDYNNTSDANTPNHDPPAYEEPATTTETYLPATPPAQEPAAAVATSTVPVADGLRPNVQAELAATAQTAPAPTRFIGDQPSLRRVREQSADSAPAGRSGNGKPGPSDMEGPQTPSLSILKRVPDEIQVGKAAEFQVTIRNVGQAVADDVLVRDEVPFGTELIDTSPPAGMDADGGLVWQLGVLRPGNETTVTMRVMPRTEGEIGSVARVMFASAVSAKARCTRPQLTVEHVGPRKVLVGEDVIFKIKLHNPGTGAATNVVIEEDVPTGLRHSAGGELEYAVGTLRPGETRLLELTLKADKPGNVENLVVARGDSGLTADHSFQFEVVAPLLRLAIQGPKRRYLEREATFDINVANPGTAAAKNIDLVAHLPRGLKFLSTNNQGKYNAQEHAVHWNLAELPDNEMGTVRLTATPTDMGDQKIRVEGKAHMNLADSAEHVVTVDGLAALLYTVKDVSDPIEVGGQTTYDVRVVNQGSKAATNLILAAQAPAGMQPISGEGPTRGVVEGQRIIFDPLARLAPQGETTYRVNVKAFQPGDMRLKFHLVSDEVTKPVTKEESTHVYSDE